MNLSRATMRQLIGMDLTEGIIDAVRASNPHDTLTDHCLRRLAHRQWKLRHMLAVFNEQDGVMFDSHKEYRRYKRTLEATQDQFLGLWSNEALDGREYVSAVLLYLEELYWEAGRTKEALGDVITELTKLYDLLDPELTDAPAEVGQWAGERLVEMV